ncbi:MAG: GNAT family N-acetyltransferase [Anaerolineales bacterium]|jgi:GNAT superfamily N-acetyltransferase
MTVMAVTIRAAIMDDVPKLAELADQLGYPCKVESIADRLNQLRSRRDHAILVAESATAGVMGWVHVFVRPLLIAESAAEIGGLVVDSAVRSQGIGEKLLEAAEVWALEAGYARLRVRSNVIRKRAHRFYHLRAYQVIKTQVIFEKLLQADAERDCS